LKTGFNDLTDEDKLALAIEYKAHGTALPEELRLFLVRYELLDLVMNPQDEHEK